MPTKEKIPQSIFSERILQKIPTDSMLFAPGFERLPPLEYVQVFQKTGVLYDPSIHPLEAYEVISANELVIRQHKNYCVLKETPLLHLMYPCENEGYEFISHRQLAERLFLNQYRVVYGTPFLRKKSAAALEMIPLAVLKTRLLQTNYHVLKNTVIVLSLHEDKYSKSEYISKEVLRARINTFDALFLSDNMQEQQPIPHCNSTLHPVIKDTPILYYSFLDTEVYEKEMITQEELFNRRKKPKPSYAVIKHTAILLAPYKHQGQVSHAISLLTLQTRMNQKEYQVVGGTAIVYEKKTHHLAHFTETITLTELKRRLQKGLYEVVKGTAIIYEEHKHSHYIPEKVSNAKIDERLKQPYYLVLKTKSTIYDSAKHSISADIEKISAKELIRRFEKEKLNNTHCFFPITSKQEPRYKPICTIEKVHHA